MTDSVRNLIMGHIWIFQLDNNPKTNQKTTQKLGHLAQNQASAVAIPVLWPEPCRKWVEWTEEKKHQHGTVNLKDLERFWMKEWSLISCQVFSNLIRHYRIHFRAVKLANGGFKKYWINGWTLREKKNIWKMIFHPFDILIIQWKVIIVWFF